MLYEIQMNAYALIGQSAMVYWDVGITIEEFVNHLPATRDLRILFVFFQHPTWFISKP